MKGSTSGCSSAERALPVVLWDARYDMSENPFWAWLKANDQRLRDAVVSPREEDPLFDEVLEKLHEENDQLFFLLGGEPKGEMEFIVTAEGDVEQFPADEALVASAPAMAGWQIIAFKPPMGHELVLQHEGAVIDGEKTWFKLDGGDIVLACAGWSAKTRDAYQFAAVEMLDAVLGELLSTRIESIEVVKLPGAPEKEGFRPLAELGPLLSDA